MVEEDVVQIYNGLLLSRKESEIMLFAATWMDLEGATLSEMSGRGRQAPREITYMWNVKNKASWWM